MKVRDMIELLKSYDPEAEIRILDEVNGPCEYSILGIVTRHDRSEFEPDFGTYRLDADATPNDVFIVDGDRMCGGTKNASKMARHPSAST